jgi:hypothetical protein
MLPRPRMPYIHLTRGTPRHAVRGPRRHNRTEQRQEASRGGCFQKAPDLGAFCFSAPRCSIDPPSFRYAALRENLPKRPRSSDNSNTMDDIVRQALAKWPNVPHCYGWLGLDARGNWYMRDDRTQAAGPFPQSKGSLLKHEKLVDFIHRNYASDAQGQWFFQNGPQRVYVALEATPFVWRVDAHGSITAHTGQEAQFRSCLLDENGWLYLDTDIGFGLVHTLDVAHAAEAIDRGQWPAPAQVEASALPARFSYVQQPFPPGSPAGAS